MTETEALDVKGIRITATGGFEMTIYHKSLQGGRVSRTFDTRLEAATYKLNRLKELKAGVRLPELDKTPINSVQLTVLLRHYQNADSAKIAYSDRANLAYLQNSLHGTLADVTTAWVDAWVRKMKRVDRSAPSTVRKKVESLARAIDWWYRREYQDGNPPGNPLRTLPRGYSAYHGADIIPGEEPPRDIARDRRLNDGEYEAIEAAIMGHKRDDRERVWGKDDDREEFRMLFRLIVNTGLRLREAYRLRVSSIRFQLRTIHVHKSKTGVARDVPMSRKLEGWLREHIGQSGADDFLFNYWNGSDDPDQLAIITARLSKRFATLFEYAGCEDLTEHDLRHEATCLWMNLLTPTGEWLYRPEEVQRITGHKTAAMMARYFSVRGSDLAARLN